MGEYGVVAEYLQSTGMTSIAIDNRRIIMTLSPGKTTIGFIGIGVMGKSMAGHLLKAGYTLHIFTRTKSKASELYRNGAIWEESVADLSEKCDVIITMVGYPHDVHEIYLEKGGIIENAKPGTLVIDMTTSSPELAEKIYNAGKKMSIEVLDAPVSGGDTGARNASLSIMVGGDKQTFTRVYTLFEIMGTNIVFQGGAGSGQHTKIANQMVIAAGIVAVCESLAYTGKAGLDPEKVLESIGKGAAGSWTLNTLGPRMIKGDFEPGFYVKHFIKDMDIAINSSKALGLETPGLILARSLYQKLADQGYENKGTQILYKLFTE